ncbi:MAG: hypothetical protein GX418_09425 [Clostridiales bacterium]|nr:hypothetical protein [Clostridiales bacterium]
MRELTLRVDCPRLSINGEPYDLRLTELELYTRAQALFARCARFGETAAQAGELLAAARDAAGLLDETLGEGAAARISGGRPVSLTLALEWLGVLAEEAAVRFASRAAEDDEDDGGGDDSPG